MTTTERIELTEYSMPQGRVLSVVAARHLRFPITVCSILTIGFLVAGFFDLRFLVVALMVLFVVTPMLMAWVYIRHCLTRDAAMNVAPHEVSLSDDYIEVRWRPSRLSSEKKEAEEADRKLDELPRRTDRIGKERIKGTSIGLKGLTVWLSDAGTGEGFLYIPYDTIPQGEADRVVEMMTARQ